MAQARKATYRVIAALLQYPEPVWLDIIAEVRAYIRGLPAGRTRQTLDAFLAYMASQPLLRLQENYTAAFDLNPATTLNMSYHLCGDGRKRAALLAQLQQGYCGAGYAGPAVELPDFLPAMVEFMAVCGDAAALAPFRRCLAGLGGLVQRLEKAAPPYARLLQLLADDVPRQQAETGAPSQRRERP